MDEQRLDELTKSLALGIALGVAGFIAIVASVALFGPQIVPYMNKLPW